MPNDVEILASDGPKVIVNVAVQLEACAVEQSSVTHHASSQVTSRCDGSHALTPGNLTAIKEHRVLTLHFGEQFSSTLKHISSCMARRMKVKGDR